MLASTALSSLRRLRNAACLSTAGVTSNVYQVLDARGMVEQTTAGLLAEPLRRRTVYAGFDPTADSLHVGSLSLLMTLGHFARSGHSPIVLLGGATGRIGDPSGRKTERAALDPSLVDTNSAGIGSDIRDFWTNLQAASAQPLGDLTIVNNLDWYRDWDVLRFLGEVGRHFRVKKMLAKDSMKQRMDTPDAQAVGGPTFLELSYALFQSYDYKHLYDHHRCTLQIGGSDQWGNITSGVDLIRRFDAADSLSERDEDTTALSNAHGLTIPLVTNANGEKIGKSAGNVPVWLAPRLTSHFEFYQYFLRAEDAEVPKFLRFFTLLESHQINEIVAEHTAHPEKRIGQRHLADETTRIVRGAAALHEAQLASAALFGKDADLNNAPLKSLKPQHRFPSAQVLGALATDVLVLVGAAPSRAEAKRLLQSGAVTIGNQRLSSFKDVITAKHLHTSGKLCLVQIGKKNHQIIELADA